MCTQLSLCPASCQLKSWQQASSPTWAPCLLLVRLGAAWLGLPGCHQQPSLAHRCVKCRHHHSTTLSIMTCANWLTVTGRFIQLGTASWSNWVFKRKLQLGAPTNWSQLPNRVLSMISNILVNAHVQPHIQHIHILCDVNHGLCNAGPSSVRGPSST